MKVNRCPRKLITPLSKAYLEAFALYKQGIKVFDDTCKALQAMMHLSAEVNRLKKD